MKKGGFGILGALVGCVVGAACVMAFEEKIIKEKTKKVDKFKSYYAMLNQWLEIKQGEKSLARYFEKNNYKNVAIYGMGELGTRLYEELKKTNINVVFAIDKKTVTVDSSLVIYEMEDELPDADVVVVTATFAFEEIRADLQEKVDIPIVSLEDVICEAL